LSKVLFLNDNTPTTRKSIFCVLEKVDEVDDVDRTQFLRFKISGRFDETYTFCYPATHFAKGRNFQKVLMFIDFLIFKTLRLRKKFFQKVLIQKKSMNSMMSMQLDFCVFKSLAVLTKPTHFATLRRILLRGETSSYFTLEKITQVDIKTEIYQK